MYEMYEGCVSRRRLHAVLLHSLFVHCILGEKKQPQKPMPSTRIRKHDPKKMTKTTPVIITRGLSQSQAARQTLGFGFARWKMQKLQVPISAGTKAGKVVIWADVKAKEESIQEGRREMRWKAGTCSWEGKWREDSACRDFSEVSLSELEENDSNFAATQSLLSPFSPLSLPLT